ncbi:hypothetical protein SDC9_197911 [bioreactor metagenome]|uniref:Uncharacterized protein n=1 Tax=bioreactor metagenome TaxID=1076179 RepID=A0A645IG76_9ZZZZ
MLLQEFDRRIGVLHRKTAVRLVDYQVRLRLFEHRQKPPHTVGGDDVKPLLFERFDHRRQVAAAVAGEQADGGAAGFVVAALLVPLHIFPEGLELRIFIGVEEGGTEHLFGSLRFFGAEPLAVDRVTDIVEHPFEVFFAAVAEIVGDFLFLGVGQGVQRGFGAG